MKVFINRILIKSFGNKLDISEQSIKTERRDACGAPGCRIRESISGKKTNHVFTEICPVNIAIVINEELRHECRHARQDPNTFYHSLACIWLPGSTLQAKFL